MSRGREESTAYHPTPGEVQPHFPLSSCVSTSTMDNREALIVVAFCLVPGDLAWKLVPRHGGQKRRIAGAPFKSALPEELTMREG